jgi:hypothetical protein
MGGVVINIPKLEIRFDEEGFSTSREGRYTVFTCFLVPYTLEPPQHS